MFHAWRLIHSWVCLLKVICVKVKVRSDNRFCRECLFISQVGRRQVFPLALHCKGYFASCDRQDCTCTSMSVSVGLTWTTCAWLTMHSMPRWKELEINVMVFIDIPIGDCPHCSFLAEMWGVSLATSFTYLDPRTANWNTNLDSDATLWEVGST